MTHLAWVFGFMSTTTYAHRVRNAACGAERENPYIPDAVLARFESLLVRERVGFILILLALILLSQTAFNGPMLAE